MGLCDVGQFGVEHASEGEQVVALVLQRHAQRANAPQVLRLTFRQLLDDEVEQHLPRGQARPSQRQNVMAQPLSERSDVAGQSLRLGLGLPRKLNGQFVVRTKPTRAADLGLQLLAPRPGTLGEARQCVGEALVLTRDVKHIAMARCVVPGGLLPSAQALPSMGNCIVRFQSLPGSVK